MHQILLYAHTISKNYYKIYENTNMNSIIHMSCEYVYRCKYFILEFVANIMNLNLFILLYILCTINKIIGTNDTNFKIIITIYIFMNEKIEHHQNI